MGSNTKIADAVIERLPRYYRVLGQLDDECVKKVTSKQLAEYMGLEASLIRRDLSLFGEFGVQGYGYNVKHLRSMLSEILGLTKEHDIIIIGAGHLGVSLAEHLDFAKYGFVVKVLFDKNKRVIGKNYHNAPVLDVNDLGNYLNSNPNVQIAAITTPKEAAQHVADVITAFDVPAIWNFTSWQLETPKETIVENIELAESLMHVSYKLTQYLQGTNN